MYKLLIWGTGKRADSYMKERYFDGNCIVGFIDSVCRIEFFYDYPVYESRVISEMSKVVDFIIIATKYYAEIYKFLSAALF